MDQVTKTEYLARAAELRQQRTANRIAHEDALASYREQQRRLTREINRLESTVLRAIRNEAKPKKKRGRKPRTQQKG